MGKLITMMIITAAVAGLAFSVTSDSGTLFTAVKTVVDNVAADLTALVTP